MPRVIVKLYAGRPAREKSRLADALTDAVMTMLNYGEESVSIGIEDVKPEDWTEMVYKPDILGEPETIYKKPGYDPT
jgi:4-oxalocrotonate tautomerase